MSFHPETDSYHYWRPSEEIELKELVESSKYSFKEIGKILGRTGQSCQDHSRVLGFRNKYIRRIYTHDKNFWSDPNPINSYYAGFSAADASVTYKTNSYRLEISTVDIHLLENFNKVIKNTGPIKINKRIKNGKIKETCSIRINGAIKWMQDLNTIWSITPQKAHRISKPILNDRFLEWCWFIGYVCGDGSITSGTHEKPSISMTSCSQMALDYIHSLIMEDFPNVFIRNRKNNGPQKTSYSNAYRYSISGLKSLVIIDYLRQFPVPKLSRKWDQPQVLELIEKQKKQYPHFFKTLQIPEKWLQYQKNGSNTKNSNNKKNNCNI
jgi:hypothetical protein